MLNVVVKVFFEHLHGRSGILCAHELLQNGNFCKRQLSRHYRKICLLCKCGVFPMLFLKVASMEGSRRENSDSVAIPHIHTPEYQLMMIIVDHPALAVSF